MARRLGPQAESRRVSLNVDLSPDFPRVLADQDRIIQILINLASNALQYTSEGGKITISIKRLNGAVQISVRDTGSGIPPEHMEHSFDRFYRVDKSRSPQSGGGSGIGLTIARALVEAHGGRGTGQRLSLHIARSKITTAASLAHRCFELLTFYGPQSEITFTTRSGLLGSFVIK